MAFCALLLAGARACDIVSSWQIPEIVSSKYGPDSGLDPERNHDFVALVDFKSAEDYLV